MKGISIVDLRGTFSNGLYTVVAVAKDAKGRTDMATGAVPLDDKVTGEARSNAIMKAETKAKRRVTLSLAGLGWLDESETDSIVGAQVVDMETGELPNALPAASGSPGERRSAHGQGRDTPAARRRPCPH